MKVNQSFIINSSTDKIKMLEKPQFVKELAGLIAKKNNKVIDLNEIKKLNNMSYTDIAKKYSIKNNNMFTKLTTGIYCIKINTEHTLGLLIDKSIEDFKKIYEKNKLQKSTNIVKINNNTINKEINSKVDINSLLNHELQHKLLNIREKLPVKIDSLEEQKQTNKIISNKLRNLEVNKMLVKNYVKKAAVVGIAAVAGLSLFACKKAKTPIPNTDIKIDVDANLSDGDSILSREDILKGNYKSGDKVSYENVAVKVLNDQTGLIDRKLGDRPGHELNKWSSGDQETWGSYTATLEDVASWPIGPHGYQEPPEDFKIRIKAAYKEGKQLDDYARKFIDITRASWTVVVEIDGKRYGIQGSDLPGHNNRTVVSLNKENTAIDKELLLVSGKNKSSMTEILTLALGNDVIKDSLTNGAEIKNNIIDK